MRKYGVVKFCENSRLAYLLEKKISSFDIFIRGDGELHSDWWRFPCEPLTIIWPVFRWNESDPHPHALSWRAFFSFLGKTSSIGEEEKGRLYWKRLAELSRSFLKCLTKCNRANLKPGLTNLLCYLNGRRFVYRSPKSGFHRVNIVLGSLPYSDVCFGAAWLIGTKIRPEGDGAITKQT